jgi:hypothetical protein
MKMCLRRGTGQIWLLDSGCVTPIILVPCRTGTTQQPSDSISTATIKPTRDRTVTSFEPLDTGSMAHASAPSLLPLPLGSPVNGLDYLDRNAMPI